MIKTSTTSTVLVSIALHAVVIAGAISLWTPSEDISPQKDAVTEPTLRMRWVPSLLEPSATIENRKELPSDAPLERAEFESIEIQGSRPRVPSPLRGSVEPRPPRAGSISSVPSASHAPELPRESIEPAVALVPPALLRSPAGIEIDARLMTQLQPEFPRPCRLGHGGRRPHGGAVLLEIEVDQSGAVGEVRVLRSSGCALLDGSAVKTGRQLRFEPARRNGVPIPSTERQTIRFRLDDGSR